MKIHPLFRDVIDSAVLGGASLRRADGTTTNRWEAHSKWSGAGKPVVEEEPETVPEVLDGPYIGAYCSLHGLLGCRMCFETYYADLKRLKKTIEELKAKARELEAVNDGNKNRLGPRLKFAEERVLELEAKLAEANAGCQSVLRARDFIQREERNAALESVLQWTDETPDVPILRGRIRSEIRKT